MNQKLKSDIIEWDVKTWSRALYYWEKHVEWNTIRHCLELGGRRGGLSLWLALKGKHVICSDLSDSKTTAHKLHIAYNPCGCRDSIDYQDINAVDIPYENEFDVITFKSVAGGVGYNNHIELQQKMFEQIYKALKPGGKLLFAENLTGSPLHQWARKNFVKWGASWRYVSMDELHGFLEKFSSCEMKATGFLSAFGRTEWQRRFFALFDSFIFNRIIPNKWKYVSYGIATK
jgi:SAM-dependent methyltransferase